MSVQAIETQTPAEAALARSFAAMQDKGAAELRRAAWAAFSRKGLPNRRVEAWHYTDLRAALRVVAPLGDAPTQASPVLEKSRAVRLVVLDGFFRPDLSDLAALPDGVAAQSLRETLAGADADVLAALAPSGLGGDDAVVALNAALMQDGVVVRIAPGLHVARPLELAILTSGGPAHGACTRSLIVAGDGSKACVIERSKALAPSGAQENHALVFAVGSNCEIEHVARIAPQGDDAIRVYSLLLALAGNSDFKSFGLIEGGGLVRRQIFARFESEDSRVAFDGVSLLRARHHADITLFIDHASARCVSRERFRTILDGEATGVFQGKAIVRPGAQKTDGAMQSKALLLSEGAAMNSKPELEIFADDVVCGHGATCGRLDADQLFYLEARGLPRREAEGLLIEGFANEAIDNVSDEAAREEFSAALRAWLAARENNQ
ncbi:MAG: SufD family Fe-S cluster assembly protein [Methylocystis sp.]|nr:SufD family Fe-S cluster assembly protein [Methylocystis sp.]